MLNFIDGNAMGHAHHRATALSFRGMPTQAIFGYMNMLRKLRLENPGMAIVVLWDGHAKWRYDLYPGYKGAREEKLKDPDELKLRNEYRDQVPAIKKVVQLLGIKQIVAPDHEADDLAGYYVRATTGIPKRLTTGDEDWLQLVDASTEWNDPRNGGIKPTVNHLNFHERTGYATTGEFLEGKVLQGDTSDSINGIVDIGPKTAVEFIAEHRSVQAFFDKVDSGVYKPKTRKSKTAKSLHPEQTIASPEGRQLFARNMKLMDLRNPRVQGHEIQRTEGTFNPVAVRTLAERLGFVSITRAFDNWIGPFARPLVNS